LSHAAEKYSAWKLAMGRWQPSTEATFRAEVKNVIEAIGDKRAKDVTTQDIEAVLIEVSSRSSKQWCERLRSDMTSMFRWLKEKHEAIPRNPWIIWDPISIGKDEHQRKYYHFSKEEIEALTAPANLALKRFVWTACYTGLRRGSIYGVSWEDVDSDWIAVIKEFKQQDKKGHRVPLHSYLRTILERGGPDDPLIPDLPSPTALDHQLKRLARRAGIDPNLVYPHQFRRTWCRWAKEAGVTRQEAMEFLASSGESTLIRCYWPEVADSEKVSTISKF
jgi:integrase